MFKIGDFSKMCQVPVSALRYYADLGLFEPAHIDHFTGFRYYTLDQLPRLHRILALKDLGLSLDEIRRLLHEHLSSDELRGMFRLQQTKIEQQLADEQARLARVAARLREIEQEGKMPVHDVILKSLVAQHVLSVRQIIPTPVDVGTLITDCFNTLARHDLQPNAPPQAIYHDEEFKPVDLDVEVVLAVAPSVAVNLTLPHGQHVTPRDLPAIPSAASLVHIGPYTELSRAYTMLGQWIAANGFQIAGPSREVYLSPAAANSDPVVEIQWPVRYTGSHKGEQHD